MRAILIRVIIHPRARAQNHHLPNDENEVIMKTFQ